MSNNEISVFVVHPSQMMRCGFERLAEQFPEIKLAGGCASFAQSWDALEHQKPDVVVVCIERNAEVLERISESATRFPSTNIIGVVERGDHCLISELMSAGARGLCSPQVDAIELYRGIQSVAAGALWFDRLTAEAVNAAITRVAVRDIPEPPVAQSLTSREQDVLDLLAKGMTNQQIAHQLHLSVETVKSHIRRIMDKTSVRSRRELIAQARNAK